MSLTPFTLKVDSSALARMRELIEQTTWPTPIAGVEGWRTGAPIDYLRELARYWAREFNWGAMEQTINRYDQFLFDHEGQPIHVFHVKSQRADAKPLLLLHGWPSSGLEYLKVIELLTAPKSRSPAFHLVIPTIPGFGLSSPVLSGWHSPRMAKACSALMQQLGYARYGIHGSDIGGDVLGELAWHDEGKVVGTHMASDTRTAVISVGMFMGGGDPANNPALTDAQKARVRAVLFEAEQDMGYLKQQATRPLTLGYGLTDSPVGQLAWSIEKYKAWTNPSDAVPQDKLDIDQVLANVTMYYLTGSGYSSANYICENMNAAREWGRTSNSPRGIAVFGCEDFVRTLLDASRTASHWSEFDQGGHFPAMEVPHLLAADIAAFFADKE